jgi:hypothetical protein
LARGKWQEIRVASQSSKGALKVRPSRKKTKEGRGIAYFPQSTLVRKGEAENWETKDFRQGATSVFILFHLIAIFFWTMPIDSPLVAGVRGVLSPYMEWIGLSQSWDTFAPNPKSVNSYVKAVVMTEYHHIHIFAFPRMEQLSFVERYGKERYRKFAENMTVADNAVLWPDIARHVARLYKNSADPPDRVMMVQFVGDITPWSRDDRTQIARPVVFYDDYVEREGAR